MYPPSTTANFLLLLWLKTSHFLIAKDFLEKPGEREKESYEQQACRISAHLSKNVILQEILLTHLNFSCFLFYFSANGIGSKSIIEKYI